ncbi:helix-turn-helix domain-containing protein [Ralstonia pseudosolanacearum]|uniref:helix-turn-helix domain-containing protein n=1 Tax=Ralstonia pseudosolanacearum TaxID=1310165 RepID=UPI0026761397|nr:helix-turn-helix domain-containing protein [Ralstonia pseudosolanacearum]MDO3620230.1 helix-turn-helix domain-containing protein [Ralstonia pseudosolanacearum]
MYLTPQQLAARYNNRISVRTLANWRSAGTGPTFSRIGGRILYRLDSLVEWENKRTVRATSEYRS